MWISEIFISPQGEGLHAGVTSVFVRTTGCNLRCTFCDTPETSWQPVGDHIAVAEVARQIKAKGVEHVVLTGGEPLLQPEAIPLTQELTEAGHFVTVETAGTIYRPVTANLMSISPKLRNSTPSTGSWADTHERRRINIEALRRFLREYTCQLKFVIESPGDLDEVAELADQLPELRREDLWLMPEGTTTEVLAEREVWLAEAAAERGWRISPRLHIEWFGHRRGT